jgi:hypothetical protein
LPTHPDDPVTHNGWVYVACCGHDPDDTDPHLVDIYLARSTDGGRTFTPSNTIKLTHALPPPYDGTHQIRPSIAVDNCGAVNVFFYQYHATDLINHNHTYEPRYLRIPSFPSTSGIFQASLGPTFPVHENEFMGDYDRMTCTGTEVYIPHTGKDANGIWNVYLSRVSVCPPVVADVNVDSAVTAVDATTFMEWFGNGDTRADLNHDGLIDTADVALFCTSYTCVCNP